MIFDDSFFQLSDDDDNVDKVSIEWSVEKEESEENEKTADDNSTNTESSENVKGPSPYVNTGADDSEQSQEPVSKDSFLSGFRGVDLSDVSLENPAEKWSSEYGNPDFDYVIESDIVMPTIKPIKEESVTPTILVIDDDFETLDLLKIYFARGYTYVPFSGPREAIFYLNEHVPDLIFLDCYIHTIKAAMVVSIIHSYKELTNVPIIYLCEDYEYGAIQSKLPEGVSGVIKRPISRKDIQDTLDKYFK